MPEMTSYEPGVPCWVDLASPDVEASRAFYNGLFGWGASEPDEAFGGYANFALDGVEGRWMGGLMPTMDEAQPPAWSHYVSVADADATAKAVQTAGGQVLAEPMDVGDLGRMAVFMDSQGAVFGVWQPRTFHGSMVVNEPNTFSWSELACRDIDAAKSFYGAVFGWPGQTSPFGDPASPSSYTEWQVSGRSIAGMVQMNEQWPEDVPPHWMVYFSVADCDASAAKATELGGTVSVEPFDIPAGRIAVLGDPQGAAFSIIKASG